MQPSQFNYPEFVPDQILTSSNLNDMFTYLDEQDRISRTNLIGVGIVCGLDVTTSADGKQLTISAGCGITSGGYLITVEKKVYTQFKPYNALKQKYYNKFTDADGKTQTINLDELFESSVTDGTTYLTSAYLQDKVVMLYVELLEDSVKNCDPGSCDDKGKTWGITFRPLLVKITDVPLLITQGLNYGNTGNDYKKLPRLVLPRFNVPATLLQSTTSIFEAYRKILTPAFIGKMEETLTALYNKISPLVFDLYPTNPFKGLAQDLAFLNNTSITSTEAINIQYYYDLFSDLELAYHELRETGIEVMSLCCPDEELFKQHLLLGNAIGDANAIKAANRQYFIPSPVMECSCKQTQRLRWLFTRLELLVENFYPSFLPSDNFFGNLKKFEFFKKRAQNTTIRITPSNLGKLPLGKKAIPFYYNPADGDNTLVDNWDIEKTINGGQFLNLSYNANQYNNTDDDVLNPTSYDLEPYNFLRIEGHIGQPYATALSNIVNLRDRNRLPFEVVMLSSDLESLKTALSSLGKTDTVSALIEKYADLIKSPCQFQDLDTLYDTFIAEITCQLCKVMLYFYNIDTNGDASTGDQKAVVTKVPLVLKCTPGFSVQPGTLGYAFEQYYAQYKGADNTELIFAAYEMFSVQNNANNKYFPFLLALENFFESFTTSLGNLDYNVFLRTYSRLILVAGRLLDSLQGNQTEDPSAIESVNQLNKLIAICIQKPMEALYRDYLLRWVYVMMLQKFGYFARKHPGLQHKAGVPIGGTFVMVYHETPVAVATTPSNTLTGLQFGDIAHFANAEEAAKQSDVAAREVDDSKLVKRMARAQAPGQVSETVGQQVNTQPAAAQQANDKPFSEEELLAGMPAFTDNVPISEQTQRPLYEFTDQGYVLYTPAGNAAPLSDLNDLDIFKTEEEKQFDDLGLLLTQIGNSAESIFAGAIADIADGTVIADFYLPYLISSDCPPIQYTVTEALEPVTISITPAIFASDDATAYPIKISSTVGDVTGEGTSRPANGGYVFTPSAVKFDPANPKQKDITINYNAYGQSVTTKVTVYQKPIADFDTSIAEGSDTLAVTNKSSAYADKYLWNFGDGQTAPDKDPQAHTYANDGEYNVTLQVSNNIALSDVVTKTITAQSPDVTISIDTTIFCSGDANPYPITFGPKGSTVTGEGVVITNEGFSFVAGNVSVGATGTKVVTLTNQLNAKTSSIDVTVYQKPVASFNFAAVAGPAVSLPGVISFTNTSSAFATSYAWDFGDGSTFDQKDPGTHTYTASGTYQVTLTVSNHDCASDKAVSQVIVNLPKAVIDIGAVKYCKADGNPYPINTGSNGGVVTGEGISKNPNGVYVFTPSVVDLAAASSKVVTITNTLNGTTKSLNVTVYQKPTVDFTSQPADSINTLIIQFNNLSTNADGYTWTFDTQGTSPDTNPKFTFAVPGQINVTLKATNGGGVCSTSVTKSITVGSRTSPTVKTCFPLNTLFSQFAALPTVDAANMDAFNKAFPNYQSEIVPFFQAINGLSGKSVDDQTAIWTQANAAGLIPKWFKLMSGLISQINIDTIINALAVILSELIEYIACYQSDDIDKARVSMQGSLDGLGSFCQRFLDLINKASSEDKQALAAAIAQLNRLPESLQAEINRVTTNKEDVTKANYLALLQKILALFTPKK